VSPPCSCFLLLEVVSGLKAHRLGCDNMMKERKASSASAFACEHSPECFIYLNLGVKWSFSSSGKRFKQSKPA
jgi:hypothetical protein